MKALFNLIALLFVFAIAHAQQKTFDSLMSNAKRQFVDTLEKPDYGEAIDDLEKAVKLQPANSEAHYYLGYAYSRFNSSNGETILSLKMPPVLKVSEQLEKVIQLTPYYNGQIIVLDPYSKLTSEWGVLALYYVAFRKTDSALWALNEGKRRGGFNDFMLAMVRTTLKNCNPNTILISSGDNYTFSLLYLQTIEKLRTDVTVIDISMLNTTWYPRFIEDRTWVRFGFAQKRFGHNSIRTLGRFNSNDSRRRDKHHF